MAGVCKGKVVLDESLSSASLVSDSLLELLAVKEFELGSTDLSPSCVVLSWTSPVLVCWRSREVLYLSERGGLTETASSRGRLLYFKRGWLSPESCAKSVDQFSLIVVRASFK